MTGGPATVANKEVIRGHRVNPQVEFARRFYGNPSSVHAIEMALLAELLEFAGRLRHSFDPSANAAPRAHTHTPKPSESSDLSRNLTGPST